MFRFMAVNVVTFQVCTTDVECFCDDGFVGTDCSEKSNFTLIRLTTTTSTPTSSLTTESVNITNFTLTTGPHVVTTLPRKIHWTGVSSLVLHAFFVE